jgi:hypothetical protein
LSFSATYRSSFQRKFYAYIENPPFGNLSVGAASSRNHGGPAAIMIIPVVPRWLDRLGHLLGTPTEKRQGMFDIVEPQVGLSIILRLADPCTGSIKGTFAGSRWRVG